MSPSSFQDWVTRARRFLRPPRTLKVTRMGRTFLVLTLGVGLGALNTGNNLLYLVLGLQLAIIVVSGILSERCLRGLEVRRLGSESPFAGEPFPFRWTLRATRSHAFALTVREAGGTLEGTGQLGFLEKGKEQVVRATAVAERRGPLQLGGIEVTTIFPLGLFAKTRAYDEDGLVVVYPRRGFACAGTPPPEYGQVGEAGNPRLNDGNGDLLGLRELLDGEDARRVHWLKSAAAGKLLRTEREREERRSFVLSLPAQARGDELERRCEELAALAIRLIAEGNEVGLEGPDHRLRPAAGPGQLRRILDALAWAGFEIPAPKRALREEAA